MGKKKQLSSIELLESHIDLVRRRLTAADRVFCGDVISRSLSKQQLNECMIGSRRSKICPQEIDCVKEFGMGLRDFHALVVMCFDRWQNRPMKTTSKKRESYNNMGVSAIVPKTPQWEHVSEGFREIQLRDYPEFIRQTRASGYHVEDRASPCEHERRGHIRTLKDGRKIYVRPSIINKGGEKVVYKIID